MIGDERSTGENAFQRGKRRMPAPREAPEGYWRDLSQRVASGVRCCNLRRPVDVDDDADGTAGGADDDDDCSVDRSLVALDEVAVNQNYVAFGSLRWQWRMKASSPALEWRC